MDVLVGENQFQRCEGEQGEAWGGSGNYVSSAKGTGGCFLPTRICVYTA